REALRELRARPREPRAHGADVDAAHLRRIRIRELRELAQDEDVAVVRRDRSERTALELRCLAAQHAIERRVALDVLFEGRRVVAEALGIGRDLALARRLAREVAGDPAKPRGERAARGIVLAWRSDEMNESV